MLCNISLKNFKSFSHLDNLPIRPITILCGTNSCGKSSILQSILLIKQTLESQNPEQVLLLNGRLVHLGSFENIIFQRKKDKTVTLSFSLRVKAKDLSRRRKKNAIPLRFLFSEIFNLEGVTGDTEIVVNYTIGLSIQKSTRKKAKLVKPVSVKNLKISITAEGDDIEFPTSFVELIGKDEEYLYDVTYHNIDRGPSFVEDDSEERTETGEFEARVIFENLFPDTIFINRTELGPTSDPKNRHLRHHSVNRFLNRVNTLVKGVFSGYSYIGPLREEPARRYIYEDEIVEIGTKGENAAYIYLAESEKAIDRYYTFNSKTSSFDKVTHQKLSDAAADWLGYMNIRDLRPESKNEIIHLKMRAGSQDRTRVNIADVGFGISQIFPIIIEGLRAASGNTLLLEQPEIHLHPKLQMQLADYLISLALSDKSVIVETHSEHLVNRLVRRIVEDKTNKLKDLVGIYFVKPTESGSSYEEVTIDESRGITNWPDDFFDHAALEHERIIMAGIEKRKYKRQQRDK